MDCGSIQGSVVNTPSWGLFENCQWEKVVSSKFIAISEIAESIKDFDPSIDTSFMVPHWTGDWQLEISDEELERIMDGAIPANIRRSRLQDAIQLDRLKFKQ